MRAAFHLFVLITLGTIVCPACADTLKKIKDTGSITLAHRESSVPFSYLDANKKPIGYTADLCLKLVDAIKTELKLAKLDVKWLQVSAADRIPSVRDGKADLECGNTTNTPERRKDVAFAVPTYIAGAKLMAKGKDAPADLNELFGKRVVTMTKSTSEKLVNEHNTKYSARITVVAAKDHAESFAALAGGSADVWMMDDVLLYAYRAQAPKPGDFTVSQRLITVEPLAIMLRKDEPKLAEVVNREIRKLMTSGELTRIYTKWFQSPIPPNNINLDLPMNRLMREFVAQPSDQMPQNF